MNRKAHWQTVLALLGAWGCTGSFDAGSYRAFDARGVGSGGQAGNPPAGTGGATVTRDASWEGGVGTRIMLKDENNYVYGGWVDIPPIMVAPKSDLSIDWGGLTKDKLGHPMDAKREINMLMVLMWRLPPTMLKGKMRADMLDQRDLVTLPVRFHTDGVNTSARLSQFQPETTDLTFDALLGFLDPTYYPPDSYTYTVMATTGTDTLCGNRMVQAFQLDPNVPDTTVKFTDQSMTLVSHAILDRLAPVGLPAGRADITLDATNVSVSATGAVFDGFIEAFVGHYVESPVELEQRFTDLELLATDLYRGQSLDEHTIDLSTLITAQGKPFAGIDASGTWLIALRRDGCRNPTPLYLSVLRPI